MSGCNSVYTLNIADSTRVSANDVDSPIDILLYEPDSFNIAEHRYEKEDLRDISSQWEEELKAALNKIPEEWMDPALKKI